MSTLEETASPKRPLPLPLLGAALIGILLLAIGTAAWGGYQSGLSQRENSRRATQSTYLTNQFQLGLADLAAKNYEAARERFTYILEVEPGFPGAAGKLAEINAAQNITPTPTPAPTQTPVAVGEDPATLWALARQSYAAQNWAEVITRLSMLRKLKPDYEALQADRLLASALRNQGVSRIQAKDLEAGIFDLNQAETFGPLDTEAQTHRLWARYYLDAQLYRGIDWKKTVALLRELHNMAPYFHDTAARLYEATKAYATQLYAAADYCGAAEQFTQAQTLQPDPAVADKLAQAQAQCASTPIPDSQTPTPPSTP